MQTIEQCGVLPNYLPNTNHIYDDIDLFNYTETQSILTPPRSEICIEQSTSNRNGSMKRAHSPIILRLPCVFESPGKKKKLNRKTKSIDENRMQNNILKEYWDTNSKKVVKEQFERDKRIKIQEEREEQARIERARKQRLYNGESLDVFYQQQTIEFELVLETNPFTDEIIIEVPLLLVMNMKPHQIDGVRFLWNQVFESTTQIADSIDEQTHIDRGGSGAILAHCMGLGKTFTTIVLLQTLFKYSNLTHIHRVLILCPLNTAINWKNEFHEWLNDHHHPSINVYLFTNDDIRSRDRLEYLRHWHEDGGVLLMGYEIYRRLTYTDDDNPYGSTRKHSQKERRIPTLIELNNIKNYRKYLRDPGPDLVICDEGHIIKNPRSAINCTLNRIRTRRRIVLTGTPMQNNLTEYYAMVHFCKPNYLGTEQEFSDQFRNPIEKGQHKDSSPRLVALMKRRIYALHKRLQTIIHRRSFDVLRSFLPPKFEYAIKIRCQPTQRLLYETYIENHRTPQLGKHLNMTKLFADYQYLMKIWTHPWLLKPYFIEYYDKYIKKNENIEIENIFEDEYVDENNNTKRKLNYEIDSNSIEIDEDERLNAAMRNEWWFHLFDSENSKYHIELSGKLMILKSILDECYSIGDKLLIFSRSLIALDYLENSLSLWNQQSSSIRWEKGVDYFRIDGKIPIKQRASDMKLFNDTDNHRSRLYLISTLAGGLGVNLFSANRVIILDTSWNPAHDLQAMFRSYRLGQSKPVYIYRLIVKGTMEEKIYKRQITKEAMFHRVVDAQQLERHFTYDELAQLYEFNFDSENDPMDRTDFHRIDDQLLKNLIINHSNRIVSFCEHDSFLIHHDEDNLTQEEQEQANDEVLDEQPSSIDQQFLKFSADFFSDIHQFLINEN